LLLASATLLYCGVWMVAARFLPAVELGYDSDYLAAQQAQRVTNVLPGSPAEAAGMRRGDRILAIDGLPLNNSSYQARQWTLREPGDTVRLTLQRGSEAPRNVTATLRQRQPRPDNVNVTGLVARHILNVYPLPFIAVGLTVLFLRVDDWHAWLLALVLAGFASTPALSDTIGAFAPGLRPFTQIYQGTLIGLFGPLFYLFFSVFPTRSPVDRRLPWLKWVVLASAVPAGIAGYRTGAISLPEPMVESLGSQLADRVAVGWLLLVLMMGVVALAAGYFGEADEQARRKIRVMFWGTVAALVPNVVIVAVTSTFGIREPNWLSAVRALFAFVLPLSMAYAVVKHRVLEIPVLLRRGARYLFVQRGFTVVLAAASVTVTLGLATSLAPLLRWLGREAQTTGIAAGAGLGVALLWSGSRIHRHVGERIDRAFFRQAYDGRAILQDLAHRATTVTDRVELADLLSRHVADALQPEAVAVYLRTSAGRLDRLSGAWDGAPEWLPDSSPWLAPHPIARGTEGLADEAATPGTSSGGRITPELLVPVVGREHRVWGLLALGTRRSEEPYSREDASLLTVAANQAALALENLSLAEEIAGRLEADRRNGHELAIAHGVQQMLLPQRMPALASLDYAGSCTQARVVGGDYFDYLDLGPGRVGFVIADISGKGIAASLLMANLQATVHSHARQAADDLPAMLRSVNAHFLASTAPNRFATLFFGIFDDATRTLTYVNCGHNPPLVCRADGSNDWLVPTAIAIGFFDDWTCATGIRHMQPGDVLTMYSDGITEAWSADGREYGDSRLAAAVRANMARPAAEIARAVVEDVTAFGAAEQSDDITIIVAVARGMATVRP
jgi:phosphoserine phosphatase RsbU/P